MTRWSLMMALCAACVAVFVTVAAGAPKPPERLPVQVMMQPNDGDPLSIDSGVQPVRPCEGASQALQPTWMAAARAFGLRWQVLAAITKVESDFGCNMGPSSAGAIGWTQFIPSTWERWGMDADGDGRADPRNSTDAVFSTARYLRVTGAPENYRKAIFAYNHADWYVTLVLRTAREFGNVSDRQFRELAAMSARSSRLRDDIAGLQERLDEAQDRRRALLAAERRSRRKLRDAERQLDVRQRQFERVSDRLNDLTLQYISVTQGVAQGAVAPKDGSSMLLQYVSGSSSDDAALVYAIAQELIGEQTRTLAEIRRKAQQAAVLRQRTESLVAVRGRLLSQRTADRRSQQETVLVRRTALRDGRRALRDLRRAERRYARELAQSGFSEDDPFGGVTADLDAGGKVRWPVAGPVVSRFNPNRCLAGVCRPHEGVDIAVASGSAVRASTSGRVTAAGWQGGYGNMVCVETGEDVSTCSAHLSQIKASVGDVVRAGDVVGRSGCTGRCFGPHVHFEVRVAGKARDPLPYLRSDAG